MKILFVNVYQGLVARGAESFVRELSKRLDGNIEILSGKKTPRDRSKMLWRFFLDRNGLDIALFTIKNIKKIIRGKYDIVIPLNGGWQSLIIRLVTLFTGSKMVIAGQSGNGWDDRINLYCFPDCFVSLTNNAFVWARKINRFVNIVKIHNGVDVDKFSMKGAVYNSGLKKPVVLAVGAFTLQKNLKTLIEAVSSLNGVSLLLVGSDGDQKDYLYNLGKTSLGGNFKITTVPFEDMPAVYRSADVFALVSKSSEAFGNAYIEAMSAGLPVVATDDPQRREVVGDGGFFVDPGSVSSCAMAIEKAIRVKNSEVWRNQAKKFSWNIVAKEYDDLFYRLVQR